MLGTVLRELRKKKNLSLKSVNNAINITDSRLSKFENGDLNILSFKEILELTELYDSSLIYVLTKSNYISLPDNMLKNLAFLNTFELEHLQHEIDFIIKIKEDKL